MCKFTILQLIEAVSGQLAYGNLNDKIFGVVTDSREAGLKSAFFALIGETSDGHLYIDQAIENGAGTIVLSDYTKVNKEVFLNAQGDVNIIVVEDTLKALQDLAKAYLKTLPIKKIIGVTGSVGKTSTRDMIYYISKTKYKTGRNPKNYNNWVGLPLTILGLDEDCQVAVLEMGMSDMGQIALLADIANPDIGVITNIGQSHIEILGTRENIFKAKMEITKNFTKDSILVVNGDNDLLTKDRIKGNYRCISIGTGEDCEFKVMNVLDKGISGVEYTLNVGDKSYRVALPILGAHNSFNSALALAVGVNLGITIEEGIQGLKATKLTGNRLNIKANNHIKIIDDTYNASLESMKSAISTLVAIEPEANGRRIAILGDIFELGKESENVHREIGKFINESNVDILIAIGENSRYIIDENKGRILNENMFYYKNRDEAMKEIENIVEPNDVVLVKASNGMGLKEISKKLEMLKN